MAGCGDVTSLESLQIQYKHQVFEIECITGKVGGTGADIDYATNQVTGQTQKTQPAILRDIGFEPASFDFTSGGTLTTSDRNKAVLWPLASGGDGDWYYWEGALPKVIPAASTPASTGGVAEGAWRPVGDIALRGDLASSSPGKGVSLVYGAASDDDVDASIALSEERMGAESVVSELNSRASLFNRQMYEVCRVAAPTSAPANAGYSQSIFVKDNNREVYVTFDPDSGATETGTKYIGKYNLKTGGLITETIITAASVGHLDSLFVDASGFIWTGGRVGYPALLKIDPTTGGVVGSFSLNITHSSPVLVAFDTSVPDKFAVWGRFGGDKIVVYGKVSDAVSGVIPVTTSPISYPQAEILQGMAYLNDRMYFIFGAGGVGEKTVSEYRVSSGAQQGSVGVQPDPLFVTQLGGQYEPEGLCVFSERNSSSVAVNMYFGWVFGDGTKSGGFTSIYKYAPIGARQTPSVDGYAGRTTGSVDYQLKHLYIRLRYNGTAWEIETGDTLSLMTANTIRNLSVSPDNLSITFDLVKPYQDVLHWPCDGTADFVRFARAEPAWIYKPGGATSNIGHQIRFIDLDSANYKAVNASPVASGQRISLNLVVIQ